MKCMLLTSLFDHDGDGLGNRRINTREVWIAIGLFFSWSTRFVYGAPHALIFACLGSLIMIVPCVLFGT